MEKTDLEKINQAQFYNRLISLIDSGSTLDVEVAIKQLGEVLDCLWRTTGAQSYLLMDEREDGVQKAFIILSRNNWNNLRSVRLRERFIFGFLFNTVELAKKEVIREWKKRKKTDLVTDLGSDERPFEFPAGDPPDPDAGNLRDITGDCLKEIFGITTLRDEDGNALRMLFHPRPEMNSITINQAKVLVLRFDPNVIINREAAEILGLSEGTVESRFQAAKKRLIKCSKDKDNER
jgi:DNA-directed RNA polymerase specialized sigma24 family protein